MTKSEARKAYWANIPKEERTKKARNMALIKNQNMSLEEKVALSKKMNDAKYNK